MQVITPQAVHSLSKISNYMAGKLAIILLIMFVSGLIPALIVKFLFFWAPRDFHNWLLRVVSGLGVVYGLYLAFKIVKF